MGYISIPVEVHNTNKWTSVDSNRIEWRIQIDYFRLFKKIYLNRTYGHAKISNAGLQISKNHFFPDFIVIDEDADA